MEKNFLDYYTELVLTELKDGKIKTMSLLTEAVELKNIKPNKFNQRKLRIVINHIKTNAIAPVIGHDYGYQLTYDKQLIELSIKRF